MAKKQEKPTLKNIDEETRIETIKHNRAAVYVRRIPKGVSLFITPTVKRIYVKKLGRSRFGSRKRYGSVHVISREQNGWNLREIILTKYSKDSEYVWATHNKMRFKDINTAWRFISNAVLCSQALNSSMYNEKQTEEKLAHFQNHWQSSDTQSNLGELLKIGGTVQDIMIAIERDMDRTKPAKVATMPYLKKPLHPKTVKEILDREVIGNEAAKRALATAVAKHVSTQGRAPKSNMLIIGPSGSGKTELIRTLKKHSEWNQDDIPVISYDASQLTPAGWRGIDIADIMHQVIQENRELDKVEQAIVQLDEFDKITNCEEYGSGLYQQMLRMIEGGHINAGDRVGQSFKVTQDGSEITPGPHSISTDRILFILSGVFHSMQKPDMGFNKSEKIQRINAEGLIKAGIIPPELMGRIQTVVTTEKISQQQWCQCIHGKMIARYGDITRRYGINLEELIDEKTIAEIVQETYSSEQGLRATMNIIDEIINDAIYNSKPSI